MGFEVARRLQEPSATASIPLVAVTASAMVGDRDRVLAAGFDGYLAKPIDPETFVRQMESFLPAPTAYRCPSMLAAEARPAARRDVPSRQTILAVDNLPVNLELARSILEPSGYKVITAASWTRDWRSPERKLAT